MLKNERQNKILDIIQRNKKVTTLNLVETLGVSKDSIRRDLKELNKKGLINKFHGGAESKTQKVYQYNDNAISNIKEKEKIAKKAASIIKENMSIIISGGTTNLIFSRSLPKNLKITVYTYSLPIAMELSEHPNTEIIFIGGKIAKKSMVTVGIDVIQKLSEIKADFCFIGTAHLNTTHGITESDYEVALVKKAMIEASDKTISLVTSNKLNSKQSYNVCPLSEIDTLITDLDVDEEILRPYLNFDCKII